MNKWLALAAGGLAGTFSRYFLSTFLGDRLGLHFPYGTLAVNLLGCAAIGCAAALVSERFAIGSEGWMLLVTGFCGAFTTFSALIFETTGLVESGHTVRAITYLFASLALGILAFRIGNLVGKLI